MSDFAADDADTDKAIVVITDGANYQFTPPNSSLPTGAARTLQNVLEAWQESPVPIYIMGFGIPADEAQETEMAFGELAERTGGQYYPVGSGADLLTAMRTRLGLGVYNVLDDAGNVVGASEEESFSQRLNLPVRVDVDAGADSRYQVSFQSVSKEVQLEGGEALELFVASDGRDIVSRPFERDFPVSGTLVTSQRSDRCVVRVHRPLRSSGVARFPISLQHADLHYTRRPAEVWVQIAPLTGDETRDNPSYLFYDVNWEPNLPVPLLQCRAPDWPDDATQARVNCWFKYERTPPVLSVSLADLRADVASYSASQPIPTVPGVQYRILMDDATASGGDLEFKVLEEHVDEPVDVHRLVVHVRSEPPIAPHRILHQFDADNGVVIHTFSYDVDASQKLARSTDARIEFVTRAMAQDGAWHLEDDGSLTVEVFSASDNLPSDAATGVR
jgi:hypothetical protein